MPKAGDLVIDELGNIGILMHNGYIWLLKHPGKPVDVPTLVSYTDSDKLYKFEGAANEEVFLFVGEEPPIMDDDGEWVDPRKEGLFWSEEDFNFDFDKLLGTVKFPELNKGERIEMNLQFEFGIK